MLKPECGRWVDGLTVAIDGPFAAFVGLMGMADALHRVHYCRCAEAWVFCPVHDPDLRESEAFKAARVAEHDAELLREQLAEMTRRRDRWKTIAETPQHVWRERAQVAESKADSCAKRLVEIEGRIAALCTLLGARFPDQAHDIGYLETHVKRLHDHWLSPRVRSSTIPLTPARPITFDDDTTNGD